MKQMLSHDLSDELIAKLGQEVDPAPVLAQFAAKLAGASAPTVVESVGAEVFGSYGVRLMERALELGEEYSDQTYEILKQAAKKTGRLHFPHVAQRFLEIAYLATQDMSTVDIVENNHYRLVNRMGPYCVLYKGVKETCGEAVGSALPCKHACLSAMTTLYDRLRLDVSVTQEASMSKDGQCRFVATNNRPLEPTPWKR